MGAWAGRGIEMSLEDKIQDVWERWMKTDEERRTSNLIRMLRENNIKVIRSYRVAVEGSCLAGYHGEHSHIVIKIDDYEVILCEKSGYILYKA
jgi:hypothetical protein